jgi:hypothetical protein
MVMTAGTSILLRLHNHPTNLSPKLTPSHLRILTAKMRRREMILGAIGTGPALHPKRVSLRQAAHVVRARSRVWVGAVGLSGTVQSDGCVCLNEESLAIEIGCVLAQTDAGW